MNKKAALLIHPFMVATMLLLCSCEKTLEDVARFKDAGKERPLISTLKPGSDSTVRIAAAKALGDLKSQRAVEPLANLLNLNDRQLAMAGLEALGQIGGPAAENHLIVAIDFPEQQASLTAMAALGTLRSQKALPKLTEEMKGSDTITAAAAMVAIGDILQEKSIPVLAEQMKSHSYAMRLACIEIIKTINTVEAKNLLMLALNDVNGEIRRTTVDALVKMGDEGALFGRRALRTDTGRGRTGAVAVLKELNDIPEEGEDFIWYLIALMPENNVISTEQVADLAAFGEPAIKPLIEAAAHVSSTVREYGFRALELIGEPAVQPAIDAVDALSDRERTLWFEQRTFWKGFPNWRIDLWGALTVLNPEFNIRTTSLPSLPASDDKIKPGSISIPREILPTLIRQTSTTVRKDDETIDLFGSDIKQANTKEERARAIRYLIVADTSAIFPLIAALNDKNDDIAATCAEILARIGDPRFAHPLAQALERRIAKGEELSHSPFYTLVQELNDPQYEALLLQVRPNEAQVIRLIEQTYPDCQILSTQVRNELAAYDQPIGFVINYELKETGVRGTLQIGFRKDKDGVWSPSLPLPKTLTP